MISAGAVGTDWVGRSVGELESTGHRVLAVSSTSGDRTSLIGLIALGDPPREDSCVGSTSSVSARSW